MFHVLLYQPEIPPNTGNIIRLAANAGAALHLIRPLGFTLDDARLRRAGLDYREYAKVAVHEDLESCCRIVRPTAVYALSTRGKQPYHAVRFPAGAALLFGPETRGLPDAVLESLPPAQRLYIPMRPGNRSLNLSNAVAIVLYEAWRQHDFAGTAGAPH